MYHFNYSKALEATGVLLRTEPSRRMNYMRLLKLLYISDRESLKERSAPITGDRVCAMKNGPVLSHVYDIIKGENSLYAQWERFVGKNRFDVELIEDPGIDHLSKYEIDKLNEVSDRFWQLSEFDLSELTHSFPEWQKNNPGNSSKPIPLEDILEALQCSDRINAIRRDAEFNSHLAELFEE